MDLDPVVHEPARLAILATLAVARQMSFTDLRDRLGLSDGNLSVHARTLQHHGLLDVRKLFVLGKPLTRFGLTPRGRGALQEHIRKLERLTKGV
jgi:DNA-binding transcriptional ArsR family regulator